MNERSTDTKRHQTRKIRIFAAFLLLSLAVLAGLLYACGRHLQTAEKRRLAALQADLVQRIRVIFEERAAKWEQYDAYLYQSADLEAAVLRSMIRGGRYEGERILEEGAVIEEKDGKFIYPEGVMPIPEAAFSLANPETSDWITVTDWAPPGEEAREFMHIALTKLSDRFYYIEWTGTEDSIEYADIHMKSMSNLHVLEDLLGGEIFLVFENGDDWELDYAPEAYAEFLESSTLPFSAEILATEEGTAVFGGQERAYLCSRVDEDAIAVFVPGPGDTASRLLEQAGIIFAIIFVCLFVLVVYVLAAQAFVEQVHLSEFQRTIYSPEQLRRVAAVAGIVSLVIVFGVSILVQALSGLYLEIRKGRESLELILEREASLEEAKENAYRDTLEWYRYFSEKTAAALGTYGSVPSRELLGELSRTAGSEYILVFDENGAETASSADYINLTLSGLCPESDGLMRLLNGEKSVVLDPYTDAVTGKTRQYFGARLTMPGSGGDGDPVRYGAVVLAMDPVEIGSGETAPVIESTVVFPGDLVLGADDETGEILCSSDPDFIGSLIPAVTIPEKALFDGWMDTFRIGAKRYYGISAKREGMIWYYMAGRDNIMAPSLSLAVWSAILFGAAYLCLAWLLLRGYTREAYEKILEDISRKAESTASEIVTADGRVKYSEDPSERWNRGFRHWNAMYPEQKARLCLDILLAAIASAISIAPRMITPRIAESSMFAFIAGGQWTRGVNIFSMAAILYTVMSALLAQFFLRFLTGLLNSILSAKGETVCRLVSGLLQYVIALSVVYRCFDYLGFDTTAIVTTVSILTLAVSLGSRDLITDILAGIAIIFDGDFRVGDIVSIGGHEGTVLEIGVRSTKLRRYDSNIVAIANHDVKNVVNMTRLNSWYTMEVTITQKARLEEISELLKKELPKIGASCPEIISGPFYAGMVNAPGGNGVLILSAECKQTDISRVKFHVNREVRLLFEREGVLPLLVQPVVIEDR